VIGGKWGKEKQPSRKIGQSDEKKERKKRPAKTTEILPVQLCRWGQLPEPWARVYRFNQSGKEKGKEEDVSTSRVKGPRKGQERAKGGSQRETRSLFVPGPGG
jgi:hypothetical protein